MKLILASASPRRAEILRDAGLRFEIARADVAESRRPGESARAMTRRLARAKARAVIDQVGNQTRAAIIIGADTIVEVNGKLLGKPQSRAAAGRMLAKLSGKTHRVLTSVATIRFPDRVEELATESTRVRFAKLSANEIAAYVATGEPLDKAGAYAVQGIGGRFIEGIDGCYFNVVGLPLARLYRMLTHLGWKPAAANRRGKAAR
jgi:septum formation protein